MQDIAFPAIPSIPDFAQAFSPARTEPYWQAAGNDPKRTVALYYWNARLGQSLWWPIHVLEVLVRNSVHRALLDKYGADWLSSPDFLRHLHREAAMALMQAKRKAPRGETLFSGVIVSGLSFGFWVSLLSQRYHVPFGWHRRLAIAFPEAPIGIHPGKIHQILDDVRALRNRIAHNEPIHCRDLPATYTAAQQVIEWISPSVGDWVNDTCDFLAVWEARPMSRETRP